MLDSSDNEAAHSWFSWFSLSVEQIQLFARVSFESEKVVPNVDANFSAGCTWTSENSEGGCPEL